MEGFLGSLLGGAIGFFLGMAVGIETRDDITPNAIETAQTQCEGNGGLAKIDGPTGFVLCLNGAEFRRAD